LKNPWNSEKLATAPLEIIDGDRGNNYPKQNEFFDSGYCLFLNAGNVTINGFAFSKCQFISEDKDDLLRKGKLSHNDIVMTTRGTIGNIGFFNEQVPYDHVRINSGMVIFRCKQEKLIPSFLYQFLRSSPFKAQVNSIRSGVAQPQLPIRDMKYIDVPVPPLDTQKRIADILSAYDDLIENNQRRIALLEQSACLIYREWFVYLCFPGHEHVKIIDGVPEGWEKKPLVEIGKLNYGKALKADVRIPGPFPVYGSSGVVGHHEKALVKGPGIIVGRKGNVGSIYWSDRDFFPIDTVYYVDQSSTTLYLFYSLLHTRFINTDGTVPGLNRGFAHSCEILLPKKELFTLFQETVAPVHDQISQLQNYSEALERARDLLLPRLMNGEIAV